MRAQLVVPTLMQALVCSMYVFWVERCKIRARPNKASSPRVSSQRAERRSARLLSAARSSRHSIVIFIAILTLSSQGGAEGL